MLHFLISIVLFLKHSIYGGFHNWFGKGFNPSGFPLQDGKREGQGTQVGSELLHRFCWYSPKNDVNNYFMKH